jgi:hypothetical protein
MAEVRLELAKEELESAKWGTPTHGTSPNIFLQVGLELEEQQCVALFVYIITSSLVLGAFFSGELQ